MVKVVELISGRDGPKVRPLDPCSNGCRFKTTFRPVKKKGKKRIKQLYVIPFAEARVITLRDHIKRRTRIGNAGLVYLCSERFAKLLLSNNIALSVTR